MAYRIDNPGGGDCGFYSAAIGLIDIIQQEYKLEKKSKTFLLWQSKGLNDVSLEEILAIDLKKLHNLPYTYEKETLLKLQLSLRNIAANADKNDLFERIDDEEHNRGTKVEGSPIFHKFMELVHYFSGQSTKELDEISHFNELAFSDDVIGLAIKTAETLETELERLEDFPENDVFSSKETIENDHVKKVFLEDVVTNGRENPGSVILKGAEEIKKQGRWATHCDLKKVAVELEVNLCVDGINDGVPDPNLRTLSLNNEGESHWPPM